MSGALRLLSLLVDWLGRVNGFLLWLGRQISWVLIGVMVLVILLQVFYRYVLNSALPWPEEAARALMVWMMALTAPSAYRWGGFVNITMISDSFPRVFRNLLAIATYILAAAILIVLLQQAANHFNSGFIFRSSTLKIPLAWIYLAMSVCFGLLMSVNLELLLRHLGQLFGQAEDFPLPKVPDSLGAE